MSKFSLKNVYYKLSFSCNLWCQMPKIIIMKLIKKQTPVFNVVTLGKKPSFILGPHKLAATIYSDSKQYHSLKSHQSKNLSEHWLVETSIYFCEITWSRGTTFSLFLVNDVYRFQFK